MLPGQGADQFARHEYRIARFRARTQHALAARHPAQQCDRDEDAARVGGSFAPDNGHLVPSCQSVHAYVNRLHKVRVEVARQSQGHERCARRSRHRRNITQTPAERLVADLLRRRPKREMNALHHRICLEQEQPVGHARIQHGAIVPCTHDHGRVGGQHAGEVVDQVKLVHNAPTCCENSSLAKLNALNSMWAVMGASKLFVRSYSTVNTRARTASGKKVARFMWIVANSTAVPHNASRGCPACLIAGKRIPRNRASSATGTSSTAAAPNASRPSQDTLTRSA